MRALKLLFKLVVLLGILGYIAYMLMNNSGNEGASQVCERLEICIEDSARASFVKERDVVDLLSSHGVNPVGRMMGQIDAREIINKLETHAFILDAQCYKSAAQTLHVKIVQRLPVMRIIVGNDNYYIDGKGKRCSNIKYPADVVVATGKINDKYVRKYLAPIGRLLSEDSFWNNQIMQINVKDDGTIEMMPRVGNHVVFLGKPVNVETKLKRLKTLYDKAFNQVGWNKYKYVDLQYDNQIVCTRN